MRGLVAWLLAAAFVAAPVAVQAQDGARPAVGVAWPARVSYVVDGDSIWVRPEGGGARTKLRLDGIDAPEICQHYGREARDALTQLLQGQPLRVTIWAHDQYGRAIASVARAGDGLDVAREMVSLGWAWSDTYRSVLGKYWREEATARHASKGLFAERWPEPPVDFRRRHGSCAGAGQAM